ncbi:MAG: methylenetetrahydrofolate reductase [NAD(P)H] [Chloroflexota bacterium]|nr:methylenetetrahydrofolate reductase [NAD(P)H] [Chloroflexota bacterium]
MKIGEIIDNKQRSLSFEFFPPKDEPGETQLFENIHRLETLQPTFVSVTYGAGGGTLKNTHNIIERILRETSLNPMPHLTCIDQSKTELRRILKDYRSLGVDNVLALRGDPPKGTDKFVAPKKGFCHANDMVALAVAVGGFSIGVAVYPEGHMESPDPETDMYYTRMKIEAGADFGITQMFFDNRFYYDFMERAAKAGIHIPIIPGIMPITDVGRIKRFSQRCGAALPDYVEKRFEKVTTPQDGKKVGIELATEMCADLLKNDVFYFHFYTLNQSDFVLEVVKNLGLQEFGGK